MQRRSITAKGKGGGREAREERRQCASHTEYRPRQRLVITITAAIQHHYHYQKDTTTTVSCCFLCLFIYLHF